ncbi:MAG TPA: hypothetical protein VLJ15_06200 [Gammaproteobacteria bacterium]|nr:hypothetical protein [Gammaproteobacteria bacterium]
MEKPLTAFLYLTGRSGTTYGSICATCRGKGITEESKKQTIEDEKAPPTYGLQLGVKQLAEIELQRKRDREDLQEKQEVESKKREEASQNEAESTELKENAEKLRREAWLENKQRQRFLDYQSKENPFSARAVLEQKKGHRFMESLVLDEKRRAIDASRNTEVLQQEERNKTVDLSGGQVLDPTSFLLGRDVAIQRLESMLSGDAPVLRKLSQFYKTASPEQKKPEGGKLEKNSPEVGFVKKTWGPKR